MCRFLVTGPMYLAGLVARLNATTLEAQEAGARLRQAEKRRRQLLAEQREGEAHTTTRERARIAQADAAVEAADADCVTKSQTWMRLHTLIAESRAALRRWMRENEGAGGAADAGGGRNLLVLNGTGDDLRVGLARCTDYDLWSRVCEDSEVYERIDARHAAARRGMRFDRVLAQAGRTAVFAGLTDEERIAVGNAYGRWLRTRLGPSDVAALVEGQRTLVELGIADASDDVLGARVQGLDLHRATLPPGPRLLGAAEEGAP